MILWSLVLSQYKCVTDRQIDMPPIAKSRSSTAQSDRNALKQKHRKTTEEYTKCKDKTSQNPLRTLTNQSHHAVTHTRILKYSYTVESTQFQYNTHQSTVMQFIKFDEVNQHSKHSKQKC